MPNYKEIFHRISHVQYPLLILGLFYAYKPLIFGNENIWQDYNYCLVYMGIAISFTSLSETKRQSKWAEKLYKNKKFMKGFFIYLLCLILFLFALGFYSLYQDKVEALKELALGIIVLGIGVMGILRMSIEITEYYNTKQDV